MTSCSGSQNLKTGMNTEKIPNTNANKARTIKLSNNNFGPPPKNPTKINLGITKSTTIIHKKNHHSEPLNLRKHLG